MFSLLYVSKSLLTRRREQEEVDAIVDAAIVFNLSLGMTGALVLACGRFAQVLEGPQGEVRSLMARIAVDQRHTQVRVIRTAFQSERAFPNWGMAAIRAPEEFQDLAERASAADEVQTEAAERLFLLLQRNATARFT